MTISQNSARLLLINLQGSRAQHRRFLKMVVSETILIFKVIAIWAKAGIEPEGGEYYINFHYIDRDKGYPPKVDAVTVFLDRPAFSHFAELPLYKDWGIDLSGQQKIIDELTLKAKLFYHNHVDDFESYSDYTFK